MKNKIAKVEDEKSKVRFKNSIVVMWCLVLAFPYVIKKKDA